MELHLRNPLLSIAILGISVGQLLDKYRAETAAILDSFALLLYHKQAHIGVKSGE